MYREIPVSLVSVDKEYDFDIFLKIHDKQRLFAAKGARLTNDHVGMLRSRDTHIFVLEQDWDTARKQLYQRRSHVIIAPESDTRKKADRIYNSAMQSIKDAYRGLVPRTISEVEKNADELVKLILSDDKVIEGLKLIETTDHFTYQHSVRVGIYATALLLKLMGDKLTRNQIKKLSTGYFLHDIGMTRIPMQIIEKPEQLSEFEWKLIRMHPIWGHESIRKTEFLSIEATNIILTHHERHDGSGYPNKSKGEEIPTYARMCAIADAFESLTAQRPYRKAYEPFEALRIMFQEMSREFDPELFMTFVKLLGPEA
ncbi:MAG: HD domain-containing phosphohydrolase [Desulfomonilia bacterium]|jgi:HD-GYP domain-containing protein (c-di-GMP phosphodiesterase class II)